MREQNVPSITDDPIDRLLELRKRAARQVVDVEEQRVKLVIFLLGESRWAIRGHLVREILPATEPFFVPGCPDSIEGVINVRGDIASVVRLDRLLGVEDGEGASILMVRGGGLVTGLRVGAVLDVVDLPENTIQTPPANLAEPLRPVVDGALCVQGEPVTLIDLDGLLTRYHKTLGGGERTGEPT